MDTNVNPNATETSATAPIQLTERARDMVKHAIAEQKLEGHLLRIGLVPGGCAGFSYDMDLVPAPRAGDLRFELDGVAVAVEARSVPFLQGTVVDFVDDGMRSGFAFKNPNARSSCGCGSSFQA